jgi:penicillin-binding protein 1C
VLSHSLKIITIISGAVLIFCIVIVLVPLTSFDVAYSTVLLDRNGDLLSASIADDGQWRFPPTQNIPAKYELALLTFEDKRFYSHFGVDPLAIGRALLLNAEAGDVVSGASTITMQVIRLSRSGKARTVFEKIIEALLAVHLEIRHSKAEILGLYASHAPYGGNVVGLDAASWRYFGREPNKLSWSESALLAVLPNSPALIHPGRNRSDLLAKRNSLLFRMYQNNYIDSLAYCLATAEDLPPEPHAMPMLAPHLLIRTKKENTNKITARFVTTIDKNLQIRVNEILERHGKNNRNNQINNASALILDVHTGDVLVYIGNLSPDSNAGQGQYVDIITAARSTGSILKPLLYAGMLQSGEILPGQLIPDIPTQMGGFSPQNYNRKYQGAVPAWQAIARSLNVPAVRMLRDYGVDRFYNLLQNLGMTSLFRKADDYGLSLILGGAEGKLWDLTSIYARMAFELQLGYGIDKKSQFRVKYLSNEREENLADDFPMDAGTIWKVFEAMLEVTRPGVDNSWRNFSSAQKIAWKTGTSYGHRDAWAIGVTPEFAIGIWAGNADGQGRAGLTGLKVAAPILFDIFGQLETNQWFVTPENHLQEVLVCSQSGYRKGVNCEDSKIVVTSKSDQSKVCPYCTIAHLDKKMQWQVSSNCERIDNIYNLKWFVLPPAMEWYFRNYHSDYRPLPPFLDGCNEVRNLPLSLIYPFNNSKIYVPVEIDGKIGETVFEATHHDPKMKLFWHVDDQFIGNTKDIHQVAVAPLPGEHVLTVVDEAGNFLERRFEIVGRH